MTNLGKDDQDESDDIAANHQAGIRAGLELALNLINIEMSNGGAFLASALLNRVKDRIETLLKKSS